MTPTFHMWPHDEGSPKIPDPGLTLSEAIHTYATLAYVMNNSRADGDAVLESVLAKLQDASTASAEHHPEQYELAMLAVDMEKRFGLAG